MPTARIFSYKGHVGVDINHATGRFINDPNNGDQLGCVIPTSEIEISEEAKTAIRGAQREGGSFAALMLTKHQNGDPSFGPSSIGVSGFNKVHLDKDSLSIGRDCDLSVLDDCVVVANDVPDQYKELIDSNAFAINHD